MLDYYIEVNSCYEVHTYNWYIVPRQFYAKRKYGVPKKLKVFRGFIALVGNKGLPRTKATALRQAWAV